MITRNRLRQGKVKENRVCESESAGEKKRHINSPAAENAADRRAKHKAKSKGRANQTHAFRAILFRGYVGDVGLRG